LNNTKRLDGDPLFDAVQKRPALDRDLTIEVVPPLACRVVSGDSILLFVEGRYRQANNFAGSIPRYRYQDAMDRNGFFCLKR